MDSDGSNRTRLTLDAEANNYPAWSSDGTKIVFSSHRDGNHELYVMDADGSSQTRLTNYEPPETDSRPDYWGPAS